MRLWAWQSIIHGAGFLSYFRWRTCPYGAEQHWHGLLDQDDRDNRRIAEAKLVGKETRKLPAEFFAAPVVKSVAVMRDFDNEANDRRINIYTRHGQGEAGRWLAELGRKHIPADMLWPESDLRGYKLLILPHLKIVDRELVSRLQQYVESGGTLVLGAQSGLKDKNCHIVERPLPGLFRGLAGVEVEDWTTLSDKEDREARMLDGRLVTLNTFVERLRLRGADAIAHWISPRPVARRQSGDHAQSRGKRQCDLPWAATARAARLRRWQASCEWKLGLKPLAGAGAEVEIVARSAGKRTWLALLNHSAVAERVRGLNPGRDLIGGAAVRGDELLLGPNQVALIESGER